MSERDLDDAVEVLTHLLPGMLTQFTRRELSRAILDRLLIAGFEVRKVR